MAKNQPPEKAPAPESGTTRAFRMHPALLWDVIHRQAGTLSKACNEAAQNSVDAGATAVSITLTRDKLIVQDDGKGFVGRQEIEDFFETFGHPHEEGDAVYGRFRMGRGQLLAMGRTKYLSGLFEMHSDLRFQKGNKNEGLNYQLYEVETPRKGCRIEIDLYDELLPSKIDEIEREIARNMKYLQIPLEMNGTVINKLPKDCKWDYEDDVAYYSFRDTGSLSVYNLGVWVRDYPASSYGTGGIVVSKAPVDVNFARSDIIASCKVFKKIAAKVRSTTVEKSVRKSKLTESEWESLANAVRVADRPIAEVMKVNLLRTSSGAMFQLGDLSAKLDRHHGRIAVSRAKDMVADRILQHGIALVLDEHTLTRFGYNSLDDFKAGIAKLAEKEARKTTNYDVKYPLQSLALALERAVILEAKDFGKYVKDDHEEVPVKTLSPAEKLAFKVFTRGCNQIGYEIGRIVRIGAELDEPAQYPWQERERSRLLAAYPPHVCSMMMQMAGGKDAYPRARQLRVGASGTANGWTDGESTIWINRANLKELANGYAGMTKVAGLILHEYLHQSPNLGALNDHSPEFYETFHELSLDTPIIGRAVDQMMQAAVRLVREEKRKPTGALKKFEDLSAEVGTAIFKNEQPEDIATSEADEDFAPSIAP